MFSYSIPWSPRCSATKSFFLQPPRGNQLFNPGNTYQVDSCQFEDPIHSCPKEPKSKHLVKMMEAGSPDDNEAEKKKETAKSKPKSYEQISHDNRKGQECRHSGSSKSHNKPELHNAAVIHPTLGSRYLPPDFRE